MKRLKEIFSKGFLDRGLTISRYGQIVVTFAALATGSILGREVFNPDAPWLAYEIMVPVGLILIMLIHDPEWKPKKRN